MRRDQRTDEVAATHDLPASDRLEIWDVREIPERAAWEAAWTDLAGGDVFSHPAYVEQFAAPGEVPCCASYTDSRGARVLYAFLLRPITSTACGYRVAPGLWDIYTALLYGGPLGAHADDHTVAGFWQAFRRWAQGAGIVSEFIRMSPVARRRLDYPGTVTEQAPHIVRDLRAASEDELRMDMASNVRRGVKKARAAGVEISIDDTGERLEDFLGIYYRTMDRAGAAARFYHPRAAFETIHATFPGRFAYVYADLAGRPVSAELILLADDIGYFFLGGTEQEALRLYCNVLVHYEAILYARSRGRTDYVLTGGVTNTAEDSLLRFKRMFAPSGSAAYLTGHQVFDAAQYQRLTCSADPLAEAPGYFPAYRASRADTPCTAHPAAHGGEE